MGCRRAQPLREQKLLEFLITLLEYLVRSVKLIRFWQHMTTQRPWLHVGRRTISRTDQLIELPCKIRLVADRLEDSTPRGKPLQLHFRRPHRPSSLGVTKDAVSVPSPIREECWSVARAGKEQFSTWGGVDFTRNPNRSKIEAA